jgi:hypothetical protein
MRASKKECQTTFKQVRVLRVILESNEGFKGEYVRAKKCVKDKNSKQESVSKCKYKQDSVKEKHLYARKSRW